jgi:hypothetical protein
LNDDKDDAATNITNHDGKDAASTNTDGKNCAATGLMVGEKRVCKLGTNTC